MAKLLHQLILVTLTLALIDSTTHMTTANPVNNESTSEESFCLRSHSETSDAELSCKAETLEMLTKQLNVFVHSTAHRGYPMENLRLALRDTNLNMRENYAKLIHSVGRNVYPLIVATDCENPDLCGVGGTFKLYLRDGSMKRTAKVPNDFEIYKFLSHMVLGVFSIVSPFFKTDHSTSWIPALREFQSKVKCACDALPQAQSQLTTTDSQLGFQMSKIVNDYVQASLNTQSVQESTFSDFAKKLVPYMDTCMQEAARLQISSLLPTLQQWKIELGDDWKNAYAVIPAIWGVSSMNVRLQLLEQVMDFEQMRQQVVIVEGVRTEDEAITTLGRIVSDRALALLVFGNIDDEAAKDHAFSLSTRRDILSTYAAKAIKEQCQKSSKNMSACPLAKKFANAFK